MPDVTALEKMRKQEGMGVQVKYIMPGKQQQKSRVKQKFATLFDRVHAMLNNGKFSSFLRNRLWAEAANMSLFLTTNCSL